MLVYIGIKDYICIVDGMESCECEESCLVLDIFYCKYNNVVS